MKLDQKNTTNTNTLSTYLSDVHDTADMEPSPPDALSDNSPEPVNHPQMISRSELCN